MIQNLVETQLLLLLDSKLQPIVNQTIDKTVKEIG